MKYFSVCSGVEAATQAWEPLGWEPIAFSEIEPFPCAVLASRFPTVPNLGDMTKITYNHNTNELSNGTTTIVCNGGIDLLVGGTPCQSFSVAGKRQGLEGASGLAYHFARLIGEIRPRWFVWENVPGAISSVTYGDQRDFNFLLHAFAVGGDASLGLRYDCEYRIVDTQYVRVEHFPRAIPQRRRRVFIVGHLATDGECRSQVLLEQDGLRGGTPPRRVKGKGFARGVAQGVGGADSAVGRGGVCSVQGSMIGRKLENGPHGDGVGDDVMFTQNCIDRHAVAVGVDFYNQTVDHCTSMTIAAAAATDKNHIDGVVLEVAVNTAQEKMSQGEERDMFNVGANGQMSAPLDELKPAQTAHGGQSSVQMTAIGVGGDLRSAGLKMESIDPLISRDWKEPPFVGIRQ